MHEYVVVLVSILANNLLGLNGETLGPKKVDEETDFKKLVQRGTPMVDKSLLIKEFMDDPKNTIVVARPRGFGKSINLSMMKHFLTSSGYDGATNKGTRQIYKGYDFMQFHVTSTPIVDKSHLIKALMEDPTKTILVARPRGFGKATNLSMLKNFLEINGTSEDLFRNLSIAREVDFCKRHQNKHPIIHLSFRGMSGQTFDECKRQLTVQINNVFLQHMYLQKSEHLTEAETKDYISTYTGSVTNTTLPETIPKLIRLMSKHYMKKVVVLLEHYDSPIASAHSHQFPNEMFSFMQALMEEIFHAPDLEKGIVFGIFTAGENLFNGVKDMKMYTVCHSEYAEYFGFLESEVKGLMKEYNIDSEATFADIKDYYNGYSIGNRTVYSPWSIINCLINGGKVGNYWMSDMGGGALLSRMLKDGVMSPAVVEMFLTGVEMGFGPDVLTQAKLSDEDLYWAYLVQMGFLTVKPPGNGRTCSEIRIPNKEISSTILESIHKLELENATATHSTTAKHSTATYSTQVHKE